MKGELLGGGSKAGHCVGGSGLKGLSHSMSVTNNDPRSSKSQRCYFVEPADQAYENCRGLLVECRGIEKKWAHRRASLEAANMRKQIQRLIQADDFSKIP